MTDDRLATEWGDDRLAAAFAARSGGRPAPSDLVPATIERLRVGPRPVRARLGFAHLSGVAAAAVVLAVVAVGLFGPRPTTEPGQTHAATFGLEPITVREAIAIRDGGVDDREIAVAGYYATAGRVPCAAPPDFLPLNPTRPWCPMTLTWLMERPEQLVDASSGGVVGRYPSGPAFNPGLTLVDTAGLPQGPSTVARVTFIGHFDDRRAEFCPDDERSSCIDTFVVDRIAEIDGRVIGPTTIRDIEEPSASTEAAIDARVRGIDPALRVLSRHLIMSDRLSTIEPTFLNPQARIAAVPPRAVWVVTALPPVDAAGRTVARTFLVPDSGTDAVAEITRDGQVPVGPIATVAPSHSPSEPSAAVEWPSTILGIPVIAVSKALARLETEADNTELAVRGYYVPPLVGAVSCPMIPADHDPLAIECPQGSAWLLENAEQLEDPATHERHAPAGPSLNPLIEGTVPFDVPEGWFDAGPTPLPVVVVGHFADARAHDLMGTRRFVVDALVWRAGSVAAQNPILLATATLTAPEIATLLDQELGPARAGWTSVVAGASVTETDSNAIAFAPELASSEATWAVRRLVNDAGRPVVRFAYIADGTNRVWTETGPGWYELATTLDVTAGSSRATGAVIAQVADDSRLLTGARPARDAELAGVSFMSLPVPPDLGSTGIEVANVPGNDREVAVRWLGAACDEVWRVDVSAFRDRDAILVSPRRIAPESPCEGRDIGLFRTVILRFAEPTRASRIEANTNPSGG